MYLKSIEVNGFKSFANKITFKFEKGITGIVGPNGSGKSNVSDAVRWVLGEQSAKQLRGAKMEDVIFAGTELRKPQGAAYVAITLDNSDHSLPIDYNEVTVARRVYRSGESEYLINGTVSRLRDVNNLFMDTGIGKEGYSIIGQGQIEKILSGKPEDRRELFDEAAGIVKYKKNKLQTEKALEAERMNLSRVTDILKELEKQVGPLKEQSEVAKQYLIYKEHLKTLDVNSFLIEVDSTKDELSSLAEKQKILELDAHDKKEEYEFAKTEYERLENKINDLNASIEDAKNQVNEKKLSNERFDGEIKVITEQISSYERSNEDILSQIDKFNKEIDRVKNELTELFEKKGELDEKLDDADDIVEAKRTEASNIQKEIDSITDDIENAKGDIMDFISEGGSLKAKVGRYDTMLENVNLRRTELKSQYLSSQSENDQSKILYDRYNQNLSEIDERIRALKESLAKSENELRTNVDRSSTVKADISKYNQLMISLKSKKEALRNLTERYDGYGNSIKRVMEKKEHNPKIIGVVADIIQVDKEYETAIEIALGGNIQNIVTEDEQTAKEMISFLKANKAGRATFLPITTVSDRGSVNPDALSEKGVIGIASQLVKCNAHYKGVIGSLLGRSIIVDNIDNATAIARKYKQSLRLITLEGDLINPGGAMTGGAFKNSSNLLGRKRELEELDKEIGNASEKYRKAEKEEAELKMRRDSLKEDKERISSSLQKLYIDRNTVSMNISQTEAKLQEIIDTFARIKKENEELDMQVADIEKSKRELADSGERQKQAISDREALIEELSKKLEAKKEEKIKKDEEAATLLMNFNSIKQQVDFYLENIKRLRQEENRYKDELKSFKDRLGSQGREMVSLKEKIDGITKFINENNRIIDIKNKNIGELTKNRDELVKSNKEFFNKREELSDTINGLDKAIYKLATSIEKLAEKKDNLANYMWEEYALTYNAAAELKNEEYNDASKLKKDIAEVKANIKALGDVNVNAIEEYKEVSGRYEFLKTQHDDIVNAEEHLKGIIADLDRAMKETFAEKFKEIKIMFSKVFKELFGGGKADLILVDDQDVLESGIIINAQPPGKKLQNMMQLSGGEKSLTAISLLFAIQSLKPSPFCLLDEIEAALDDSNVRRYAKYLDKLTKDTQFIVITHRKGTMEAADVLYGITMQEKGVSTLVSVNMIEDSLSN